MDGRGVCERADRSNLLTGPDSNECEDTEGEDRGEEDFCDLLAAKLDGVSIHAHTNALRFCVEYPAICSCCRTQGNLHRCHETYVLSYRVVTEPVGHPVGVLSPGHMGEL